MKIKYLFFVALIVSALIVTIRCSKDSNDPIVNGSEQMQFASDTYLEQVLSFKARMEFYRDNPDLKTGGLTYPADTATQELETLINYEFCYTDIECNTRTMEISELIMPLNIYQRINDPELMQVYYGKVIDSIQAQMERVSFSNKRLLLVDLEFDGIDANGDAIISIRSIVGNQMTLTLHQPTGWWFGNFGGTCDHNFIGERDATTEIHNEIYYFIQFPAPPPGKKYVKDNIITLDAITPDDPGNWLVDPPYRDNYLDNKLFIADHLYGTIGDYQLCVTDHDEMPFYIDQYNLLIGNEEYSSGLDMTEFVIEDYQTVSGNNYTKIWHEMTITLGDVYLINYVVTQDITTYTQ
jgi:hypothetical protein